MEMMEDEKTKADIFQILRRQRSNNHFWIGSSI